MCALGDEIESRLLCIQSACDPRLSRESIRPPRQVVFGCPSDLVGNVAEDVSDNSIIAPDCFFASI